MTDLAWWLQNFEATAFRLETLERYAVPQEAEWFAEWQNSGKLPELTPDNDAWLELVAKARQAGKQIQRVHLVTPPLTDYLRFEFATQIPSVECGEDCRIADLSANSDLAPVAQECQDFWLFDNSTVILLQYDEDGRFHGLQLESLRIDHYRRLRDLTMTSAVSLKEYLAKL
jgi:hypothetical protein